ncbi:hypothetical protein [Amycolatopsis saalfeldensis]|uniref:Uncharacterized protein n=1 Tax=Amycolatopsis saalfeldensis TaxID=394193 RepID=A0A1H8Y9Z5_9PSEU|nr:hypothetical protein [Amycolatopsis saalfeldensis]SEP48896.1 hypothetical protein SAMN04489732_112188 [Amycolatopsis saalfeldensis]
MSNNPDSEDTMSFDLAVWFEPDSSPAPEAAEEKYARLCEEDFTGLVPSEHVAAFYQALTAKYPELTALAPEDFETCPWNGGLEVSPGHVLMPIAWPRAEEVGSVVRALAREHGLVCFDPQARAVHAAK